MDKKIDWIKVNKEYGGLWIALDKEEKRIISASKDAKTTYQKAVNEGIKSPILFRVPDKAMAYVGFIQL